MGREMTLEINKESVKKVLVVVGVILIIIVTSVLSYNQIEMSRRQKSIETEVVNQKELSDNITRSMNEYATKTDIEKFAKENNIELKTIQNDMKKLSANITSVNVVSVKSDNVKKEGQGSTGTGPKNPNVKDSLPTSICDGKIVPCENADPYGYLTLRQDYSLYESFGNVKIPVGQVGFSAWNAKPWNEEIYAREYKVSTVVGTDEEQRQYYYNKFTVTVAGKSYDIKIDKATTKQEYPFPHFSWWNPRLFLTTGGALNITQLEGSVNIGMTLGIMSYGQYKYNPMFSILQIGVGYETGSKSPAVILNPFNYNLGVLLPKGLVNSVYVGPSGQVDMLGNIFLGGNLSVGL
jgi:hypothetical protein